MEAAADDADGDTTAYTDSELLICRTLEILIVLLPVLFFRLRNWLCCNQFFIILDIWLVCSLSIVLISTIYEYLDGKQYVIAIFNCNIVCYVSLLL